MLPGERYDLVAQVEQLFAESDLVIHALYNLCIDRMHGIERMHEVERGPAETGPLNFSD